MSKMARDKLRPVNTGSAFEPPEALVPRGALVYHVYRDQKGRSKYSSAAFNRYAQQSTRHNAQVVPSASQVFY